jgi:hypothetical protein
MKETGWVSETLLIRIIWWDCQSENANIYSNTVIIIIIIMTVILITGLRLLFDENRFYGYIILQEWRYLSTGKGWSGPT